MHAVQGPGLYDPAFERDSCGFGLIANLDNQPSRWLVDTALTALANITHRGAVAADGKLGDGCGLLIRRPDRFLRAVADECGMRTGPLFTAGTVFLPPDNSAAERARNTRTG